MCKYANVRMPARRSVAKEGANFEMPVVIDEIDGMKKS